MMRKLILAVSFLACFSNLNAQIDTCICYTNTQDVRCLECLLNAPKKAQQIVELQEKSKKQDDYIESLKLERDKIRIQNEALRNDLESETKKKRAWRAITASTCGVILVETLLLLRK
jgi:hypothetical protein